MTGLVATSSVVSNSAGDVAPTPLTMVGDPRAAACEGDACVIPAAMELFDSAEDKSV
jgi:hypothetical protein